MSQQPPKWASNAIPTVYGWANPKTGELLISVRGLENPVEGYKRNQPWVEQKVEPNAIVDTPESQNTVTEPESKPTETPKKSTRSKKSE